MLKNLPPPFLPDTDCPFLESPVLFFIAEGEYVKGRDQYVLYNQRYVDFSVCKNAYR